MTKFSTVFGIYKTRNETQDTMDALADEGFDTSDISILFLENASPQNNLVTTSSNLLKSQTINQNLDLMTDARVSHTPGYGPLKCRRRHTLQKHTFQLLRHRHSQKKRFNVFKVWRRGCLYSIKPSQTKYAINDDHVKVPIQTPAFVFPSVDLKFRWNSGGVLKKSLPKAISA